MIYRAIGLMSGSSLDGLDIAFAAFHEQAGEWTYEILNAECYPYTDEWSARLRKATQLSALDYAILDASYGQYLGEQVNHFIESNQLQYQVALVSSHGHTSFHVPSQKMTAQLGNGAAIAAAVRVPVVTDLRAMDVALGGQGAPIVPIGEKFLWRDYDYFLNLGGIANISKVAKGPGDAYIAFDVCPANRVLNLLTNEVGKEYDENGEMAASGNLNTALLEKLNSLEYYQQPFPKSLANEFGTDMVYPLIRNSGIDTRDALRTYSEHIAIQLRQSIERLHKAKPQASNLKLLCTGGGAFNAFLVRRLQEELKSMGIEVVIPDPQLINFKEALIMAFIGVLRWRQEYNVLSSVTGAERDSVGGALWNGE